VPDPAECRRRGAAGGDVCGEEAGGEGAHPAHARQVERLGGVGAQVDGGADAVDGVHPSRRHKSHGTRQAAASSFASAASRVVDGRREGRGAKGEQAGAPGAAPEATHSEQERDERAKHVVRRRKDLGHRGGDAASAPDGEEGARHRVGAQLQRREAGARRRRRQRGGATIGQAAPRLHGPERARRRGEEAEERVPHKGDEERAERLCAWHRRHRAQQHTVAAEASIGDEQHQPRPGQLGCGGRRSRGAAAASQAERRPSTTTGMTISAMAADLSLELGRQIRLYCLHSMLQA